MELFDRNGIDRTSGAPARLAHPLHSIKEEDFFEHRAEDRLPVVFIGRFIHGKRIQSQISKEVRKNEKDIEHEKGDVEHGCLLPGNPVGFMRGGRNAHDRENRASMRQRPCAQ